MPVRNLSDRVTKTVDVNVQDQTSPSLIIKFNRVTNETSLAAAVNIDDRIISVVDATGIIENSYLIIFSGDDDRYFICSVTGVSGTDISVDSPLDFAFSSGSNVHVATTDLSVDGSSTPVVFGIRGSGETEAVNVAIDITRVVFSCIADSAVDYSLFADISKLTNGLVLRHRKLDSKYNIFNVKSNREIAGIMYDFDILSASNPAQGVDGFKGRLTFAGQNKIGVVKRLRPGEDLEVIISDDLSGITEFEMIAEGHVVE